MAVKSDVRMGFHVSISGGIDKSVDRARELGCDTFQIFSRSPRGGKPRPLAASEIECFKNKRNEYQIGPVAVHVPYFFNLAAIEEKFFDAAVEILGIDLARASQIGAEYIVLHGGHGKGASLEEALLRLVEGLKKVLAGYHGSTLILLENQAGSGSEIVHTFEEIAFVLESLPYEMGVCFDTCHGFAAGYDLRTPEAVAGVMDHFDRTVGLDRLKLVHCNDSMFPMGSKKDRHQHIGQGHIGQLGMWSLLHHDYLKEIPLIMETPHDCDGDDLKNLELLRNLADMEEQP